ncbi:hypothetical protein [Glycomyces algeriensis]|uniref:hypothetical protein n=1 Tax=Glycomyces algeriensis TaxID=256037 RepID=UPI0022D2DC55|nr:hypothetical protein [Glycomyces algeriensis]MDA1367251.1 hypothetical protein [Glycomyces algeriensis]MDR7353365.1 hypothetical protein [Glycomyces algeriensis]
MRGRHLPAAAPLTANARTGADRDLTGACDLARFTSGARCALAAAMSLAVKRRA